MKITRIYITVIVIFCSVVRSQPTPVETKKEAKGTIIFLLGIAMEFPWAHKSMPNFIIPNAFSAGIGIPIHPQFELYGTFNINLITKVLPEMDKYFVEGWYTEWGLEGRYFFLMPIYALCGAHLTTMRTRDFEQFNDSTHKYEDKYPLYKKIFLPYR